MIQLEAEKAYTTTETAEILQRKAETIRAYIKAGKLKAEIIGNAYHVRESAIKEFCKKRS